MIQMKHGIAIDTIKAELSELKPVLKEISSTLTQLVINGVELDRLRKDVDRLNINVERIHQRMEAIKIETSNNTRSAATSAKVGAIVLTAFISFFVWYLKELPSEGYAQPAQTYTTKTKED